MAGTDKPHLNTWKAAQLSAFLFGYSFCIYLYFVSLLPDQARQIRGEDNKGTTMAIISGASGIINVLPALYFPPFNDRQRGSPRFGRRKPWLVVGAIAECVLLFPLSGVQEIVLATTLNVLFITSVVVCSSAWHGLVADVTPNDQLRMMGAFQTASSIAGYLLAAICKSFMTDGLPGVIGRVCLLVGLCVTCFLVPEPAPVPHADGDTATAGLWRFVAHVGPVRTMKRNRGLFAVLLSRLWFQLGASAVVVLFNYWITDCVVVPTAFPASWRTFMATHLALILMLIVATITSATFSHMRKFKLALFLSGTALLAVPVIAWFTTTYYLALILAAVFGFGCAPLVASGFGMGVDDGSENGATGFGKVSPAVDADDVQLVTLDVDMASENPPSRGNHTDANQASDLSAWHNAQLVLPSLLSITLAGVLRDVLQPVGKDVGMECFAYKVDFILVAGYALAGMVTALLVPAGRAAGMREIE